MTARPSAGSTAVPDRPSSRSARADEVDALASRFVLASNQQQGAPDASGLTETARIGGAFLEALVEAMQPGLARAAESAPILVTEPGTAPVIALRRDGAFVRLTEPRPVVPAAELVHVRPDVRGILNQIEIALLARNDPQASAAAVKLREARSVLEGGLAGSAAPLR